VPQDGTFEITTPSGPARAAVTIVPTHTGESVVVRFEPGPSAPRLIEELGMPDEALLFLRASLTHDAGLLLVSGPFASGRTTTAAAAAAQLASEGRIVVTIEECIETVIPGARQIRADARAGTPAPAAIRLAERLDADALLIGEIRDDATAHAAVHAANGGRLVIATIDTEPGASPAQRLIAAGIPSLSINDCYLGAIAQIAAPTAAPRAGQAEDPVVVFAAVQPSGTAAAPALVADARDKASRGLITPDALASLERAIAPPGDETAPRRLSA
jgi:type II secretory ATPase GspE/PulE/Tfp pilus assembly ATPase PilB-like protein